MKPVRDITLALLLGAGAFAISASTASARVVCNDDGDCWHSKTVYEYPAGVHVTIHDNDDWKWKEGEHYSWREHEGRGYWHSGAWVGF